MRGGRGDRADGSGERSFIDKVSRMDELGLILSELSDIWRNSTVIMGIELVTRSNLKIHFASEKTLPHL